MTARIFYHRFEHNFQRVKYWWSFIYIPAISLSLSLSLSLFFYSFSLSVEHYLFTVNSQLLRYLILVVIQYSRQLAQCIFILLIEDIQLKFIWSFKFLWGKIFIIFFWPENVDQNLRQNHWRHFTGKLLILEQMIQWTHLYNLIRSTRWCNDIYNISNSFWDNKEDSNFFGKKIMWHFFNCLHFIIITL